MSIETGRTILSEIRANKKLLDNCDGPHEWEPQGKVFERRRCKKCGGTMDSVMAIYYDEGVAHGMRSCQPKEGNRG